MKKTCAALIQALPEAHRDRLSRFHKDESGSMVVFTLFIIVLMLIVGGMAVDFMRFESRRAMMQGAVDSAVLAAADLDQDLDPETVVQDYVTKSQAGNCLNGVTVDESAVNYRSVTAKCQLTMNTFFLKLIGMDQLTAVAESTAVEGVGDIEISLVVDISGSMVDPTGGGGSTKIEALRSASTAFVNALLLPEYEDKISISFVPYSQHVNVGSDLFDTLNVNGLHDWSHCVEIPDSMFTNTAWNDSILLEHMAHIQTNPANDGSTIWVDEPICPRYGYEEIIPVSQNKDQLNGAIAQLQPRAGTSIFLGVKWGITLLDPSFNDNLQALPNGVIDDVFADRPVAYADPDNRKSNDSFKYLVLMTDGMNSRSSRIRPELYDDPNEIAHWNTMNWRQSYANINGNRNWSAYIEDNVYTPEIGDGLMATMCKAALDEGIIIFGVGLYDDSVTDPDDVAALEAGRAALQGCVGSANNYFETSGDELTAIFEAIAGQITDLRLTL